MFNGTYTVKVKRNRARYVRIQKHVRDVAERRREYDRLQRERYSELATCMVAIRRALDLPVPEDELALLDSTFYTLYPFLLADDWLKQALKYLSPGFTPDSLYLVWSSRDYGFYVRSQFWDWLRTRHAIVEVLEGAHYDRIPSCYYSFQNEDFFFDPAFAVNPKGVNCTGWKYVGPHVLRPELKKEANPTQPSWWSRFLEWSKCGNYQ